MTVVRERDVKMESGQGDATLLTVKIKKGHHEPRNIGDLETNASLEQRSQLFGTRGQFRGRQFFHGWGAGERGDGSGGDVSNGEWLVKLRLLARPSPPAVQPIS